MWFGTFKDVSYPAAQIYYCAYMDVVLMVCLCVLIKLDVEAVLLIFDVLQFFVIVSFSNSSAMFLYFT